MAYDQGLASLMRDDLAEQAGISEKNMFGGLCFLHFGNMLCGVHKDGAMFRVGKTRQAAALALPGTQPMAFTGRPMGGFVDADHDLMADDALRTDLLLMALNNVFELPPK